MQLDIHRLPENPFEDLNHRWMLIGATDGTRQNAMTAGWGGMGVIWERDVFFVLVRPCRYTYELLEKTDTVTLSFFGDGYRKELTYLGRTSGRDEDKLAACGLTPVVEGRDVYFKEATTVLSGRIIAKTDLHSEDLVDRDLEKHYPKKDYHRVYVCELTRAFTQND